MRAASPIPTWDNEWRQEEDKRIHAPTMTGIMHGAYYLKNSHNPLSRIPRQEWDMQVSFCSKRTRSIAREHILRSHLSLSLSLSLSRERERMGVEGRERAELIEG